MPLERLFTEEGGRLLATGRFSPLMLTTTPEIALSDCLLYLVPLPGGSSRR